MGHIDGAGASEQPLVPRQWLQSARAERAGVLTGR
jgi:hypothetical protein